MSGIRALILDVDGVLTDGRVLLDETGRESKSLAYRDIDAVHQARREGLQVALVTGERSAMVKVIARALGVELVIDGAKDKLAALEDVVARLGLSVDDVCYVGDADRDAAALARAGLGLAPADASAEARRHADAVLTSAGGRGVVEEVLAVIRQRRGAPEERA